MELSLKQFRMKEQRSSLSSLQNSVVGDSIEPEGEEG